MDKISNNNKLVIFLPIEYNKDSGKHGIYINLTNLQSIDKGNIFNNQKNMLSLLLKSILDDLIFQLLTEGALIVFMSIKIIEYLLDLTI